MKKVKGTYLSIASEVFDLIKVFPKFLLETIGEKMDGIALV